MLTQPTVEKLCAMRLRGMAEAFREQQQDPDVQRLSFEERLGLLVDRQWNWHENRALGRRLRNARLQGPACVEDIDFRTARGLDRQLVKSLTAESIWVRASKPFLDRPNRCREDLAGPRLRPESLSRRIQRLVYSSG